MKNQKGFGLVELIVVVAILSILLLVGLPIFGAVRNAAYDATVKNVMSTGGMQFEVVAETEKERYDNFGILRTIDPSFRLNMGPFANYKPAVIGTNHIAAVIVCEEGRRFMMMARSQSGKVFAYDSATKDVKELSGITYFDSPPNARPIAACQQAGFPSTARAYSDRYVLNVSDPGIRLQSGWAVFDSK
jgi:prepilin-type N-terminal cleavage/methylation domain-containing protein